MKSAQLSTEAVRHGPRTTGPARPRDVGARTTRSAIAALVAVTVALALAGAVVAVRMVSDSPASGVYSAGARVPTSFGALWVDSFKKIEIPRTVHKGHIGIPQGGSPDKVALEVTVRLANTTAAPVEVTPARFALRVEHSKARISAEGASFESVQLVPRAVFDARVQFPLEGGDHKLTLLFDDPNGSGRIVVDLGRTSVPEPAGSHQHR